MSYNVVNLGTVIASPTVAMIHTALLVTCRRHGVRVDEIDAEVLIRLNAGTFTDRDVAYVAALANVRPSDIARAVWRPHRPAVCHVAAGPPRAVRASVS